MFVMLIYTYIWLRNFILNFRNQVLHYNSIADVNNLDFTAHCLQLNNYIAKFKMFHLGKSGFCSAVLFG